MQPEATLALDARAILGEGPIWDSHKQALWWIDIELHQLNCFSPGSGGNKTWDLGQRVGSVVPRASGGLMLALQNGFASFDPATSRLEFVADPEQDRPGNRFNEGKCDPRGRFWAGTMQIAERSFDQGALYCLHADGRVVKQLDGVGISNGIVWTADSQTMYYIDSPTRCVDAFDFDSQSGTIGRRRTVVRVPEELGFPDGMVIDSSDNLWIAVWGGWCVVQFDPRTGQMLAKVPVPAGQVTSCTFGGPELEDLYITTARRGLREQALEAQPHAGGLFVARPGTKGVPAFRFAG